MTRWLSFREWSQLFAVLKEDTSSQKVIKHLTHLEDLIITDGQDGATQAVSFLQGLTEYFSGNADAPVNISVKIDGAPAIVVGNDPADGKFFIGTKGAFSKSPRIAKSLDDIRTLYAGKQGLIDVMSVAFQTLEPLRFPTIMQGDVLFTPSLKQEQVIDGVKYVTFKPNTIIYGVPLNSDFGKEIIAAKFGVCFHTTYTGNSLQTLSAQPGANIEPLRTSRDVVIVSSQYQDLSGTITFTKQEMSMLESFLSKLNALTSQMSTNKFLQSLNSISLLQSEFMVFQNSLVRGGDTITLSPKIFASRFAAHLEQRGAKEAEKKTSDKGQANTIVKYKNISELVNAQIDDLVWVLAWQNLVTQTKLFILKKLNAPGKLRTFYDNAKGVVAGPHEGFVASDTIGNFVKLVDRSYFSKLNMLSGRFSKQADDDATLS